MTNDSAVRSDHQTYHRMLMYATIGIVLTGAATVLEHAADYRTGALVLLVLAAPFAVKTMVDVTAIAFGGGDSA